MSITVVGIDPGQKQSAVVTWRGGTYIHAEIIENREVLYFLDRGDPINWHLVIEQMVGTYTRREGQFVGTSVLDTCVWSGRFIEHWECGSVPGRWTFVPRKAVVAYLCGNAKANDSDVRAAIIDRYGGDKASAVGTKKKPGPLYDLRADLWQAAALVEWYRDTAGER